MDLEFGFAKANPSHASEAISAFPGSEDFLDAGADGAQRAVMRFQPFGGKLAVAFGHKLRVSLEVPPAASIAYSTERAS
jgi:hypothetical protein